MEIPAERKWRTLRKIASPREKAPGEGMPAAAPEPESFSPEPEAAPPGEVESAPTAPPEAESGLPGGTVEVLIVHPVASTARLIRETLQNFTDCRVVTTADPLRAFELALQKRFGLFLFAMQTGELSGPMLYELISKACTAGRGPRLLAPAVIFVREKGDPQLPEALSRDARVRDVLHKPIRIERLLQSVEGVLVVRDPTAKPGEPPPER